MRRFVITLLLFTAILWNGRLLYAQSWFDSAWPSRRTVVVNNLARSIDLNSYAVKLNLNASNFDFGDAQPQGQDLRITDSDGTTLLPYWIQSYDAAALKAVVWVDVPLISASALHTLYLYYGNPAAQSAADGSATFSLFSDFNQTFRVISPSVPASFQRMVRSPEIPTPLVAPGPAGDYDHWGFREHGNTLVDSTDPDTTRRYKMWFSANHDSAYTSDRYTWLGAAFSADGNTWVKQGRVNPWTYGEDPFVVKVGDTYFLYYESKLDPTWDRVGLMTSTDALNWTFYAEVVPPDPTRPFMDGSPSSPTVWVEYGPADTTWYLFFEGKGSCTNCGGGQIGLATSHDGYHFSVYGTTPIIPLGATGQWDDGAMVPDAVQKVNGQYWLIYHGYRNGNYVWKAGFAVSNDLIHWTKTANGSNDLNAVETGDPQIFLDRDGTVLGTDCIEYPPNNRSGIFRTFLAARNGNAWPYSNLFTLEVRGSAYGYANDSAGVLTLSGESFQRSSTSIVSTQRFTEGFAVEMKTKFRNYGNAVYSSVAIGSGDIVDMNLGGTAQWETTVLQSGYAWFVSGSGVTVRMPQSGGKAVLTNNWVPSPGLMQNDNIHRFVYDDTDSLKWYVGDTLRSAVRDQTFNTANKRLLISQGEYPTGAGGVQSFDWVLVRKYVHHEPFTTVSAPELRAYVRVTTPNGGESWIVGSPAGVTWTTRNVAGPMRIELSRNSLAGPWELLADSVPNTGQAFVPVAGVESATCRIKLSALSDTLIDVSDADFAITPHLQVISPHGGERWRMGDMATIQWLSDGTGGSMRVELNRDYPNGTWEVLSGSSQNNSLQVLVNAPASENCRIRITEIGTAYSVMSDSNFAISIPGLHVLSPNGGEQWPVSVPASVTWNSFYADGPVRIELNRNYPNGEWEILADSTENSGVFAAEITPPVSDHCRVRVQRMSDTLSDISDADFQIVPFLHVLAPDGGDQWLIHETSMVQWWAIGWPGLIRAELNLHYPDGAWLLLADSLPNTGMAYVNAGDSLSSTCRVRISTVGASFSVVSDSNFSVTTSQGYLVLVRPQQPGIIVPGWDVGTVECPATPSDTFLLRNLGSQDVTVYVAPDPAGGTFEQRSSCGDYIVLPPGQLSACEVVLSFGLPDHEGTYVDTLLLPTDASNQQGGYVRIPLSGHRIATPQPPQLTVRIMGNSAFLTWPAVTQSVGGCTLPNVQYSVYSATAANGPFTLVAMTSDTMFTDTNAVIASSLRFYQITSNADTGYSTARSGGGSQNRESVAHQ